MELGEQAFTVYAARCADGAVERHLLTHRSVYQQSLADLERFDRKDCGPHALLSAKVSRSPWTLAVEPDPYVSSADRVKDGALSYACPRCGARVQQPCENLWERRNRDRSVPTKWPHPERLALWGKF